MAINSAIPELHPAVVKMNYALLEAKSKSWKWPMSRMCPSFSPIFLHFKLKIFNSGKEKKKIPFDHMVPTACHSSALGVSERYIYQMNFLTGMRNPGAEFLNVSSFFFFFVPLSGVIIVDISEPLKNKTQLFHLEEKPDWMKQNYAELEGTQKIT